MDAVPLMERRARSWTRAFASTMLVVATYDRRVTKGEPVGTLESGVRAAASILEDIEERMGVAGFKVE